jgi:hypothetical protein
MKRIGAVMPTVSYVGRQPTSAVDAPMITMVRRNVYLRPTRSPSRPNTSAPNGRTKNPAANASSANRNAVVSFIPEKNFLVMMVISEP